MHNNGKILRLKANDKIGSQHIAVQRHTSLSYPQHWHNYFEIEIVVQGNGTHIFNGKSYPVTKGDVYLLTPVDFHEIDASEQIELLNISFDESCLTESIRTFLYTTAFTKIRRFTGDQYERLVMAAELLRRECETENPCTAQLLDYLLSRFIRQNDQPMEYTANQEQLSGMKKAVAYIELHFREKITLEQLSAISGYNPTYFSELFRKFTGQTYIDRVTELRINYAKSLLSGGLSVADACFGSGFGSLSNFLAVFKAKCGTTPSKYRKNCVKQ